MEPILKEGDIVFYKKYLPGKSIIKTGEIVIIKHPLKKMILIKRISDIHEYGVEVKGDNRNYSDDSSLFGLVRKEFILGIVTSQISYRSISKFKNFFNR
tara:strand:+ start:1258 stop:1554 length:297 start_codon:yes stop_codon:yes gene_type:complete